MADAPPIKYALTSDGVNIAYWTYGQGPPLVVLPLLIASHVQLEWEIPSRRSVYERLARGATVIRFDPRGMGMSDRDLVDFSPEAGVKDLSAVVDKLGLDRFAMFSQQITGRAGFAFAAEHPGRVTALAHRVNLPAPAQRERYMQRLALIAPLSQGDWELYTEVGARLVAGWRTDDAWQLAELIRESHTPASYAAVPPAVLWNYRQIPHPDVPVLVLHARGDPDAAAIARQFAASIADCRVVAIPAATDGVAADSLGGPYPNEMGLAAILDFIAAPEKAVVELRADSALRTILFTDLVDHTQMMTRLGDAKGRDVLREHERITREVLKDHSGTEVKTMGDGFMASFGSVTRSVECAVALQKAFAAWNDGSDREGSKPAPTKLSVRIGLTAGEPIEEDGDLFGSTVILAARIAAQAGAGEIFVSDVIRQLVTGKGFTFGDRGDYTLKGFEEPVKVYEVAWQEQ